MLKSVFSENWIASWMHHINRDDAYRLAARSWTWPVVLILEPDPDLGVERERAAYLDLHSGTCRAARPASPEDLADAPIVIRGSAAAWLTVLSGERDPLLALVSGKLRLVRGSRVLLARYTRAARLLVASAAANCTAPTATKSRVSRSDEAIRRGEDDNFVKDLYRKAKKLGVWDPAGIKFEQDKVQWSRLSELEKTVLLHLTALFQEGENAVTTEIVPLLLVIGREGRRAEELYLTTFLFEEAKHAEFFQRFLENVVEESGDLGRFHGPAYRHLFEDKLQTAMAALLEDNSPAAQARAAVTYNLIVEGTLAETGYHAYYAMLERNNLLPGLRDGIRLLKRDESRHIAYGLHLLCRLVSADPQLWFSVQQELSELFDIAIDVIRELFDAYEEMPFGLQMDDFLTIAMQQFSSRLDHLERAYESGLT